MMQDQLNMYHKRMLEVSVLDISCNTLTATHRENWITSRDGSTTVITMSQPAENTDD